MSWRRRIEAIVLAGGAITAAAGCSSEDPVPCGNASPDPCICGRPDTDPRARAECDAKTACEAAGGRWQYLSTVDDGGVGGPSCVLPADARVADAATTNDAGAGHD